MSRGTLSPSFFRPDPLSGPSTATGSSSNPFSAGEGRPGSLPPPPPSLRDVVFWMHRELKGVKRQQAQMASLFHEFMLRAADRIKAVEEAQKKTDAGPAREDTKAHSSGGAQQQRIEELEARVRHMEKLLQGEQKNTRLSGKKPSQPTPLKERRVEKEPAYPSYLSHVHSGLLLPRALYGYPPPGSSAEDPPSPRTSARRRSIQRSRGGAEQEWSCRRSRVEGERKTHGLEVDVKKITSLYMATISKESARKKYSPSVKKECN